MSQDLCVKMQDGILNIRVGAIIIKDGKFLMVENDRFDYMYSVGGRLKFGEATEEAVVREVYEETGVKMEIDRLGFIHENFFPGDSLVKKGNVATEIKNILDAENINEVILVGQSLGGMIAQYFISLYPDMVRGLIAIDSAPFGDYYSKSDMFWLSQLEWMSRLFPNKLLRILMAKACGTTEYAQRKMIDMLSDYDKKELCHLLYIGEAAFIQENKVIDIKCPIILIVGKKDRVGKVYSYNKEWTKRIGCDLHIIKGAGHNANEDCPDEVNEIIENFFRS